MNTFHDKIMRRVVQWVFAGTVIASTTATFMGVVYNFINSKVVVIQVGCLMVIIMGLFLVRFNHLWNAVVSSRIIQLTLALVLVSGLATVIGLDPTLSLVSHFERGTGFVFIALIAVASLMAILVAKTREEVRSYMLYPMAISGGILAFFTWIGDTGLDIASWVFLGPASGGGATMGNSSFAGTMLIMSAFVTLYLLVTTTKTMHRQWLAVLLGIMVVNPVLITLPWFKPLAGTVLGFIGDARGATLSMMIGFVATMLILGFYSKKQSVKVLARGALGVGVATAVLIVTLLMIPGTPVRNYFVSITGEARFIYWNMALQQVADYPVLGTGPETFRYAHERFYDPALVAMGEPWADKVHNVYLEQLLATGVVGFAIYLVLLGMVVYRLYQYGKQGGDKQYFAATMIGLVVAYGLNNIILFDTMTSLFWFYGLVMVIAVYTELDGYYQSGNMISYSHKKHRVVDRTVAVVLIGIISISGYWFVRAEIAKLSGVWSEMFSKPQERMQWYARAEKASPYGAAISFAQRADDYAQAYIRQAGTEKKIGAYAADDIVAIRDTLIWGMEHYRPNMQSYIALGNLSIAYMRITGKVDPIWVSQLVTARDGFRALSPTHPKLGYFDAQVEYYESQLSGKK